MATFLRPLSYKYPWLYHTISALASLTVGGEKRFRQLPLEGLNIKPESQILDLCCGGGQVTQILTQYSQNVTGLDVSPVALARATKKVPQATFVEGLAQNLPFPDNSFHLVHISAALHEMTSEELLQIMKEVYRVLKPQGILAIADFHKPDNIIFWPPLAVFLWLFETETAWQLIETDLISLLKSVGFSNFKQSFSAGGSLQIIQTVKTIDN